MVRTRKTLNIWQEWGDAWPVSKKRFKWYRSFKSESCWAKHRTLMPQVWYMNDPAEFRSTYPGKVNPQNNLSELIVFYFLHSALVLSFHMDVVLILSIRLLRSWGPPLDESYLMQPMVGHWVDDKIKVRMTAIACRGEDQRWYGDQSRYAPSPWETSLHCNDVSHWLRAYLDWSYWYWLNLIFHT